MKKIIDLIKSKKRFITYIIMGSIAAVVDLALLFILTEYAHIFYLKSAVISFLASSFVHYGLNKTITFKNKSKKYALQFIVTMVVAVVGLILNLGILFSLVSLGLWYMFAKIIALLVIVVFTYNLNKHVTYGWFK